MTTTRPGVAVEPTRARLADRDEYPALGAVATLPQTTGRIMGPTPHVHLGRGLLASVVPLPRLRTVTSPVSPRLPYDIPTPTEPPRLEPMLESASLDVVPVVAVAAQAAHTAPKPAGIASAEPAEPVRADAAEWKPVDPQSARAVLHVEREVEIPRGRHHSTRRPRPPQLSSGDATERMRRLIRHDKRRRAIMVAASVMVVIVLLGTIWHYTNNGYAADQPATSWNQVALPEATVGTPSASTAVSASASPSAAPSTSQAAPTEEVTAAQATAAATGPKVPAVLKANAIYGSAITGSCPEQAKPTTADDARAALSAYLDCMNSVWGPIIEAGKIRFRPASIYFYVNTIVNACTTLHTSDPVTAMYCPMDATIYVSPTGVSNAMGSRFYGSELVTHEYAHHVQSLSQILAAAGKQGWSENEYSRRIQLQAHCLSFAVLTHVDGFVPDVKTFRTGWQVGPGTDTYGSIASIQYWGERGLAAANVGACDTFSVASSYVS